MVVNFKVFKKCSPNGKITLYLGKRDFVDHISAVEPIGNKVMGVFNWTVYVQENEKCYIMFARVSNTYKQHRTALVRVRFITTAN